MADQITAGYNKCIVVTPSDTVDLPGVSEELYVGGTGNITGMLPDGSTVLISAIPIGQRINVAFKRIMSTGTTATLINSFWTV